MSLEVSFTPFPDLDTNRLELRKITPDDAASVFALRSDERAMEFIDRPRAKTIDDAMALISLISVALDNSEGITWGIALKGNTELIGSIGFWRIDKANYRAEIGYMLKPEMQGKGLMSEAMEAVLHYGFNNMNLHSVEANVNTMNKASMKLLEKHLFTGKRLVGLAKKYTDLSRYPAITITGEF
jgi:[ribosomal protein S5]-alanine N-acetyltransferase